jgi:pyruvyltransferase
MPALLNKLRRKVESQYFYKMQIRALDRATDKTRVLLRHWRPRFGTNFGDELSVAIVDQMLALRGLRQDFTVPAPQGLLGVGSILQMAREGDVVWGAGVNGRNVEDEPSWRAIDVRALRGPLTREYLARKRPDLALPTVYGDPGLLLFDLFPALLTRRTRPAHPERIVIPNLNDLRLKTLNTDLPVISPLEPWPLVCEHIQGDRDLVAAWSGAGAAAGQEREAGAVLRDRADVQIRGLRPRGRRGGPAGVQRCRQRADRRSDRRAPAGA